MATRIPDLLAPYVSPLKKQSLVLLTNVLESTTNWLVLRYVYTCLKQDTGTASSTSAVTELMEQPGVVLLSFMRDFAFWKEVASRLGLDLVQAARSKRFAFVDGLSGLFVKTERPSSSTGEEGFKVLASPELDHVKQQIELAIQHVESSSAEPVLIIDQLDFLLVAAGDGITVTALERMLLQIREKTHATILTLAADEPLVVSQATTLEREHAALALALAHEADLVIGLRMLDTGRADDVSGVMRITRGGQDSGVVEQEYLYQVTGDATVKVFERGS